MVPEHGRSQIGSLDLEASLTLGVLAESQVVHHRGGEEQLLVVGGIVATPLTFQEETQRFQAELLKSTLEATGYNIAAAARRLDLTRSHVYNLIRAFGLARDGS